LLFLASFAAALPFSPVDVEGQYPLPVDRLGPGLNIDLNALRLVQMEGKDPMWMTELQKVHWVMFLPNADRGLSI
jgi:hypothetical protein